MSEDAPHYGPMTEQRARELLRIEGDEVLSACSRGGCVFPAPSGPLYRSLGGVFSADELEAIAWWMRNKRVI